MHKVKPQVAYFERMRPDGFKVLSSLNPKVRERGSLVIAHAKLEDYRLNSGCIQQVWLGESAPFRVDATTANLHFRFTSLEPLFQRASDAGSYVFVFAMS